MKTKFLFVLLGLSLNLSAQSDRTIVRGDGKIQSNKYQIEEYNEIEVIGALDITYMQKEGEPSISIELDGNLSELLDIKVENKKLILKPKRDKLLFIPTKFCVYTNSKELAKLAYRGGGKINLIGKIDADILNLLVVGTCTVTIEDINLKELILDYTGIVNSNIKGCALKCDFRMNGEGKVNIENMSFEDIVTSFSGSWEVNYGTKKQLP